MMDTRGFDSLNERQAVLAGAVAFVKQGWTQGAASRDSDGRPGGALYAGPACSWCAIGAIHAAARAILGKRRQVEAGMLADRCKGIVEEVTGELLARWNDEPGRTRDEVLLALETAIDRAGGLA